jgi:ABC-type dipeptide/oligopeptide/nickel transport system permease subunit
MDKKLILRRMLHSSFFMIGFTVVFFIILISIASPKIVRFDPTANSLKEKLIAPEGFGKGLKGHILGTDQMGRDVFTRLLIGSRYSLQVALYVVVISSLIGIILGILSGYTGGWIDTLIMRFCDIILSIPGLVLAIAVMAVLGPSFMNLVAVLVFGSWVQYCRITRNNVLIIRSMEFVHASKIMATSPVSIMFNQIFPNVTTPLLILVSQQFGATILTESAVSFLNLGIQPPAPSWGNMIANGRGFLATNPWLVFAPGIALMITVLAFNFLGDGLRDVLDPKRNS